MTRLMSVLPPCTWAPLSLWGRLVLLGALYQVFDLYLFKNHFYTFHVIRGRFSSKAHKYSPSVCVYVCHYAVRSTVSVAVTVASWQSAISQLFQQFVRRLLVIRDFPYSRQPLNGVYNWSVNHTIGLHHWHPCVSLLYRPTLCTSCSSVQYPAMGVALYRWVS